MPTEIRPIGRDLQHQVGEVLGGEEAVVLELEDDPDQGQAEHDPQRGEVALDEAPQDLALELAARASRPAPAVAVPSLLIVSSFLVCLAVLAVDPTPVIAETTCSSVVCFGFEVPGGAAEAQDDDPVGDLEDVGEVVADHDDAEAALAQAPDQLQHLLGLRHAERRRRLVEQHDLAARRAASGRPRPAGAGRPERVPTSVRRLGIVTARLESSSPARCSIFASSSWRETSPGPGDTPPGRGRGWRRRRGCRRGRGPGRRSRSRAGSRPGAA